MVVVLADDISGAAELAGAALRRGLSAEVQEHYDPESTAAVVCVDTDTRSQACETAAAICAAEAELVAASGAAWIYKKCDSVLRGHVLAEARAIARAIGAGRITVLSANPSRQRVIRGGRYFVEGRPLETTVFAADPEYPRRTSMVAALLGADLHGVCMPDASSAAEVLAVANSVKKDTLPVGGVDFFEALLTSRSTAVLPSVSVSSDARPSHDSDGRQLLVCGSAASWAQRLASACRHRIPALAMPYSFTEAIQHSERSERLLVGIGDHESTRDLSPSQLTGRLADFVAQLLHERSVDRLLLEGGATAKAVVRAMGWRRLVACAVAPAGVGVFHPAQSTSPLIYIKPGSYPWPAEIWPG